MIRINDEDMPIVASEKIIRGTRKDGCDMYSLEELKEIAVYLLAYYNIHKETGD